MSPPLAPPSPKEHALVVLLTAHLAVIFLMAFPTAGSGLNRSAWADPTVQAEFASWRARLAAVGFEIEAEPFEEGLWTVASGFQEGRDAAIEPLKPYFRFSGAWQSWKMFVAPLRFPARLHVEVREGKGPWRVVYRPHDPEHDWLAGQLEHDRMRSVTFRYAWPHFKNSWKALAKWVATETAREHTEASQVRVRYVRQRTPSPEEQLAGDVPPSEDAKVLVYDAVALRKPTPKADP